MRNACDKLKLISQSFRSGQLEKNAFYNCVEKAKRAKSITKASKKKIAQK